MFLVEPQIQRQTGRRKQEQEPEQLFREGWKHTELRGASDILALHLVGGSTDSISQDPVFLLQVAYFCLHLLTELLELTGKKNNSKKD